MIRDEKEKRGMFNLEKADCKREKMTCDLNQLCLSLKILEIEEIVGLPFQNYSLCYAFRSHYVKNQFCLPRRFSPRWTSTRRGVIFSAKLFSNLCELS